MDEKNLCCRLKMSGETSPLKIFGQAKREIAEIFSEMHDVITDSQGLIEGD